MVFILRIKCREEHRIGVHYLLIDIVTSVERSLIVREVTRQADCQFRCVRNIDVDIRTQGIGFLVDIVVETVALIYLEYSGVLVIRAGDVVTSHFSTAPGRQVRPVAGRIVLEEHVVPVVHRVDESVGSLFPGLFDFVVRIFQLPERVSRGDSLVVCLHVRYRVGKLYDIGRHRERSFYPCEYLRRTLLPPLGGDVDDAICSSGSVQGSRSGILHD